MLFSDRMGITSPRSVMQIDEIDSNLRTALYSYLHEFFADVLPDTIANHLKKSIWCDFWRKPVDEMPLKICHFTPYLKETILGGPWYGVYNLIEFILETSTKWGFSLDVGALNRILERDMSGYTIVGRSIVPITSEEEIAALEEVLRTEDRYSGARMHMQKSTDLLSQKPIPDLANAVKEAITAVESAARISLNDDSIILSDAMKRMRNNGVLHPALSVAWEKIYSLANNEPGIRHGSITGDVKLDFPLAKYMVITCAAFVNYIVTLDAKGTHA